VALLTVDVIDSTPAVVSELTSRERGSLDRATYDLLVHGEGLDRYRSRSEVVFVLCRGMYRAGWSEDDAVQALYNKSHRGAEAWRSINSGVPGRSGGIRKRPRRWLRSVWAAAARSAEAQPSHRRGSNEFVDGSLSEWLESVEDIIRSSAPKRLSTVMLVASHLAANAGEDVQSCRGSLRSIAERCCLDTGTVHTAVRDLESYGLLETLAVGGVEVSGGGVGRTTASEWRLVTVSDMGGTPRPGAEKGAMRRTALPVSYRELDGSLSPAARWLLMRLLESELALDECAELLLMRQRSLLLAQRDRTRGGALRQLLDLGLVRQTASGTFTARAEPTKKAAAAARQVRFHGRRATDRRRRMQVRHRQQRVQAVLTLKMAKRLRMEARITEHYVARRWLEPSRATRIAVATVRVRLGEAPVAQVCRSGRSHVVACDDGTEQRYWVEADEVVIVPGDASVTRRAGRAGARKVWALRHPYLGAPKPAWTVTGRIVNASKLVEALRDLDGPGVRLERVVPDAGDRMLVLEELLPLATPSERMQLGVA
jgi:hypothetical protein